MHIEVNGTRLWFDVDGPGLATAGAAMVARPTVLRRRRRHRRRLPD